MLQFFRFLRRSSGMMATNPSGRKLRFGLFLADLQSAELYRNNRRVKLQHQAFQVLKVLLERPGELVTRDDLKQRPWPATNFGDIDVGLNGVIKKIRDALGDSAEHPLYIETRPKLGYRFIALVEEVPSGQADHETIGGECSPSFDYDINPVGDSGVKAYSESQPNLSSQSFSEVKDVQTLSVGSNRVQLQNGTPVNRNAVERHWKVILSASAVLLATLAAVAYFHFGRKPKVIANDTIVLADFANSRGDPVFDETLGTALIVALRQAPFLNLLSDDRVEAMLKLMNRPPHTPLTSEIAREVCLRTGSRVYLSGSIARLGSQYVLGLKTVSGQSGETIAQEQMTAVSKDKVLDALGKVATKLRHELGESLATVQKYDVPLAEATTSSLEALEAYTLGEKANREKGPAGALLYHQHAIELDPRFAIAYLSVGGNYLYLGQLDRATAYFTKAFDLLVIEGTYYWNSTGELEKAALTFQEEIETYPRDHAAYLNLGNVYAAEGQYEKATEAFLQFLRVSPIASPRTQHSVIVFRLCSALTKRAK